jgi:hypothetical protein
LIEPFFVSLVASFSTIIPTMKSIRVALCFFLVFFPLGGLGCGYRLGGEGFSPAPEIRSISIPTFVNGTYEAGIETVVTNALLAELIKDRRLQVVGEGEADAVMRGTVTSYRASSVAYDPSGVVSQYRAWISLDVVVRRGKKGAILWSKRGLTESEVYRVSSEVLLAEEDKDRVIRRISAELARRIRRGLFGGL